MMMNERAKREHKEKREEREVKCLRRCICCPSHSTVGGGGSSGSPLCCDFYGRREQREIDLEWERGTRSYGGASGFKVATRGRPRSEDGKKEEQR